MKDMYSCTLLDSATNRSTSNVVYAQGVSNVGLKCTIFLWFLRESYVEQSKRTKGCVVEGGEGRGEKGCIALRDTTW